ncbi:hypothetical protein [Methylococcus sp. EFPC2]|uniref:LPD3 domain-containing protein n=1 Tax=Methylococcus sp. EFPC2 TaxID=2812648 RepID=UPI00196818A1|nr:hypothetical protein [Methylococcus sp. EFPC2]QSA97500.1 hypothetical protein JWZ97_01230 [Methylococcus sp. EFPC2]
MSESKDPTTGDTVAPPAGETPQFSKFSTHRGQAPGGISREQAQQAIDEFRAGLSAGTGLDFQISDTLEDALGANHGIEGTVKAYLLPRSGTVVLIRRSLDSVHDAIQTLRHEVLAHYGLNLFEPDVKADILRRIVNSRGLAGFRGLFREVEREYPALRNDEFRIAEEVFAKIAEDTPGPLRQWFDRLLAKIAQGLRAIGLLKGRVTKAEMRALVASIAEGIRRGAPQRTFPASNQAQFARELGELPEPLQEEFAALRNRYAGTPGWLKAPNGAPSKLNENQWLMVRTPRFKAWFGDWEGLQNQRFLESKPIAVMSGNEVPQFAKLNQLAHWVGEHWKAKGGVAESPALGKVALDYHAASSSIAHGMSAVKGQAFYLVPEAIEKGRVLGLLEKSEPTDPDAFLIGAPVKIGERDYKLYVEVRRDVNMQRMYVHEAVLRRPLETFNYAAASSEKKAEPRIVLPGAIRTLAQSVADVNPDAVSKLVDENGEPLAAGVDAFASNNPDIRFLTWPDESLQQEFAALRSRYAGTPQWLKAPNGAPSKLSEQQWLIARTPRFKAWFGDWEKAAAIDELVKGAPVVINGNEIADFTEPLDMKTLRIKAREYGDEHVAGNYQNESSGLRIEVRHHGIKEAVSHGGGPDKLKAIAAIPDVLRRGQVVYNGVNPKNPQGRLVVISARVKIARELYVVSAGAREDANGRLFYDHELLDVRRAEGLSSQPGERPKPIHPAPTSTHLNDYYRQFIAQEVPASKGIVELKEVSEAAGESGTDSLQEALGHPPATASLNAIRHRGEQEFKGVEISEAAGEQRAMDRLPETVGASPATASLDFIRHHGWRAFKGKASRVLDENGEPLAAGVDAFASNSPDIRFRIVPAEARAQLGEFGTALLKGSTAGRAVLRGARQFSETVKDVSLGALTVRQVAELARGVLPVLQRRFVPAMQLREAEASNLRARAANDVLMPFDALTRKDKPVADRLAELLVDVRLAGVDPSVPFAHLREPKEMRKRIHALSKLLLGAPNASQQAKWLREREDLSRAIPFEYKRKKAYQGLKDRYEALPEPARTVFQADLKLMQDFGVWHHEALKDMGRIEDQPLRDALNQARLMGSDAALVDQAIRRKGRVITQAKAIMRHGARDFAARAINEANIAYVFVPG